MWKTFVVHLLLIRSRPSLQRDITEGLRHTKCRASSYNSKRATLRVLTTRQCSLILLSLGLPQISKVAILHALQGVSLRAPILVLSTHDRVTSGIRNLSTNTGSCLTGPFRLTRLRTHIHDLAQQRFVRHGIYLQYNELDFSAGDQITVISNRPIPLAHGRDDILRCLLLRRKHPIDRRRLVRRI